MSEDNGADSGAFSGREVALVKLEELIAELRDPSAPEWENVSLEHYLDALQALLGSIENAYDNMGKPRPSDPWQVIADALEGARYYE